MNTHTIKKSTSFHWNSYGMMEYLLVISPGAEVLEKVAMEIADFRRQFGEKKTFVTGSNIIVASFLAKEVMEGTLNRWIRNICNRQERFELALNNYSGFPPHTIYLRIQNLMPLFHLTLQLKILDDFIQSSDCPPLQALPKPHLPIAGKLSMDIFDKAIKEYARKDFHETFIVDELILQKRSHEFDACAIVDRFHFSPIAHN